MLGVAGTNGSMVSCLDIYSISNSFALFENSTSGGCYWLIMKVNRIARASNKPLI